MPKEYLEAKLFKERAASLTLLSQKRLFNIEAIGREVGLRDCAFLQSLQMQFWRGFLLEVCIRNIRFYSSVC